MRKLLFSVLALISGGLIFKSLATDSYTNVILEKSNTDSIYSGHHSHCSHGSHYSYLPSYKVNADSINTVSDNIYSFVENQIQKNHLYLRRIFYSNAEFEEWRINKDKVLKDKKVNFSTIVIVAVNYDNSYIDWYYIPIDKKAKFYFFYSTKFTSRHNQDVYQSIPFGAEKRDLEQWIKELKTMCKKEK